MNETGNEADNCSVPVRVDLVQQRAEFARACNDQLTARQSPALNAANLADIAAAAEVGKSTELP